MRLRFLFNLAAALMLAVGAFFALATAPGETFAQATISCDTTTASAAAPAASPEASPEAVQAIPFPANTGEVDVFAASSLTDSFNEIGADLEKANPGLKLVFNYAGSQDLVTQLTQGASADVFASANDAQMNAAIKGGVISGDPSEFAKNSLVLVVPKDNPAGITGLADLAKSGVKLVLAQEDVPVGGYARQSICLANADTATYGDNFASTVAGNVVSEETNVKNVLSKVQLGEADAGIVYYTDVTPDVRDQVTEIAIPAPVNVIASYPIAAVNGGNTDAANAFISYLLSPDGQATLAKWGFQQP